MKKYLLFILIAMCLLPVFAQNTLNVNGVNEAEFIYRMAPDSLNVYFRDSFAFNMAYRNFRFGMKFISDLPKYSNEQSELLTDLNPNRLELGWQELYAAYQNGDYSIHAGTTEETFGQGITFRSYQDIEMDEDHRIDSFLMKYEGEKLNLKALYGAIDNPDNIGKYDLSYGADLLFPVFPGLQFGGSAVAFRDLGIFDHYSFRDVFSGRTQMSFGSFEAYAEYATSENYRLIGSEAKNGSAIYANADYSWKIFQLGAAYKRYRDFDYRLHDLPMANYHSETLADALASGKDEEGWQARGTINLSQDFSLYADYAEAWDEAKDRNMNDFFGAIDLFVFENMVQLSYSHVEKLDEVQSAWQKEATPALTLGFNLFGKATHLKAELKQVEKQKYEVESSHYEPGLQADISLGKLSLSLGSRSSWEDFGAIASSQYQPNLEAKYSLFTHSDVLVFAGKEAGGKVCRNGMCRYVAPFEGIKMELTTRF